MTTLEEVQTGFRLASKEFYGVFRSEPDVYALTPGGEWTVRDTAVHLIAGTRMYTKLLTDQPSPMRAVYDPAVLNAAIFLAMDEDRPRVLADLGERAVESFLDNTVSRKFDDPCHYFGLTVTVGIMAGSLCNEHLLHGFDIAQAIGREWACPEPVADLALDVIGSVFLSFLDPAKAGDLQASFALEGGSARVCGQVRAGAMEPLGADADTDCSITGTSSQILLWLSGRVGWEGAGLSTSGRHPDLGPGLADKLVHFLPGRPQRRPFHTDGRISWRVP